MKATGIVRKVDELGRFVIPMEVRRTFDIQTGDALEFFTTDNGEIVLKPFSICCTFCDETSKEKLNVYNLKLVCNECITKIIDLTNKN